MAVYWLTFKLKEDGGYAMRYHALEEAVRSNASRWWTESTSFLLFESAASIDDIAISVSSAINTDVDLALLGMPYVKSARAIGAIADEDLFKLMDFTKKA